MVGGIDMPERMGAPDINIPEPLTTSSPPSTEKRDRPFQAGKVFDYNKDAFVKNDWEFNDEDETSNFLKPFVSYLNNFPDAQIEVILGVANHGVASGRFFTSDGRVRIFPELANGRAGALREAMRKLGLKDQSQVSFGPMKANSKVINVEIKK